MNGSELILSKSSLESWLSCHRKYLYAYVYRLPSVPTLEMSVGTAVHAGVEAYWIQGEGYEAEETERALDRELALMPSLDPSVATQALVDGLAMTQLYVEKIAPTFTATIVERDFLIRVDGQLVSGRIDAADENDVHDTKTTSTPSKVTPDHHRLGMTIYRFGFRALTGRLPKRLLLDVVAKNGRWKVVEVEPDDAGMAEVVGLVSRGILAGDFEPTGAAKGSCYSCAYRTICPAADLGVVPSGTMPVLESDNLEAP